MKREEEYFNKYLKSGIIEKVTDSSFLTKSFVGAVENIRCFEKPDFFSTYGNDIYIFEHFEVDASKKTKKGSESRIEHKRDYYDFQSKLIKNPDEKVFSGNIIADLSFCNFLKNITTIFAKHYSSIEEYKRNVSEYLSVESEKKFFKIVFLIEDITDFGTKYIDRGLKIANPLFSNEFLDFLKSHFDVDIIVFSTTDHNFNNVNFIYYKEDWHLFKKYAINLSDKRIFNPTIISLHTPIHIQ